MTTRRPPNVSLAAVAGVCGRIAAMGYPGARAGGGAASAPNSGNSGRPRTALNEAVKVVVRCRPINQTELQNGHHCVVKVMNERGTVQVASPKGQDKLFTYDATYDSNAIQESIYDEMVRPLVNSVLDGFNGCVFAYGQTGTGKTHTMEGSAGYEGIIPRAFTQIWQHIQSEASEDVTYLVSCSYIELYMEDVRDLLRKDSKKKLTLRGQEFTGFYIPEMSSVICRSASDMLKVMRTGNKNRTTGRTDMNEHSSRSHAIFLITIEMAHKGTETIRVGKLNLVDLAGSERQGKTNASADRLKEAAKINQALSSLGNVISALAENSPHVPYRDSKLTRILQDSLGGNSKTIMIANIGPASYNYDETITTLRYAHRAKAIKNQPIRNEDPKDAKLHEFKEEIARLRKMLQDRKTTERKKDRPKKGPREKTSSPQSQENNEEVNALALELENQNMETESHIEAERCKTEELESKINELQDRMVRGGVGGAGEKDIINNLNESQIILEQRNTEIAERKKREVEMQQKIDLEEETTAHVNQTFATLQQEVDHKTNRLKKCLAKYSSIREEMVEMREAHDRERRELEALQEDLITELKKKLLLADNFVPEAGRALVYRVRYNEDTDEWEIPHDYRQDDDGQIIQRPMTHHSRRRPISESVRNRPEMRYRAENLLDLKMEVLGTTTKVYKKPEVSPALKEVLNSALAREADIEIKKPTTARRRPTTAHHKTQGVR